MFVRKMLRKSRERQPLLQREDTSFYDHISQPSTITDNTDDSHFDEATNKGLRKWNKARLKNVYLFDSSPYTKYWDLFDVFVNVLFVSSYVLLTLLSIGERETEGAPPPPPQIYQDIDFAISVILFIQWIPRLYFALDPLHELRSVFSISTILSCLSVVWVYFLTLKLVGTFLEGGNVVFLFPFRFIRLHGSISRCFPVGKKGFFEVSSVKQKAVNLALSIFTTLAVVTAFVHICLYKVQKYYDITFFDIFYTIAVSSTSGLSTEIVPDNIFSRIITLGVMVIGAIFLPSQIGDLIELIRSSSKYSAPFEKQEDRTHVVVCGNLEIIALRGFLREFFASDHGTRTLLTHVVIVGSQEPEEDLVSLMTDPVYANRVQYIKGSVMSFRSLQKARLASASAAFVLASKISEVEPVEEDAMTVMRCVSIRKYHGKLKIFAQILLPRNKIHLEHIADHVLCLDEFKLGMVAQNCLSPGFSTMMYLLTNSISIKTIGDLRRYGDRQWIKGALMELYEVRLDHRYAGMRFKEAAALVYQYHHAVLIAIGNDIAEGEEGTFHSNQRISFVPIDRILLGGEKAFLITNESLQAHKVGKFDYPNPATTDGEIFWTFDEIRQHMQRPKLGALDYKMQQEEIPAVGSLENFPFFRKDTSFQLGKQTTSKDFTVIPIQRAEVEAEGPRTSVTARNTGKEKRVEYCAGKTLDSDIENHVLFCTLSESFPVNASYFVAPFREVDRDTPIVFLSAAEPDEEVWETVSEYENVYYIVGTPLLRKDLRRARVQNASRTVVFTDPGQQNVVERTADSCVLLSLLNIQALCNGTDNFVTVEFVHTQNMKLIGNYNHSIREAASSEVTELQTQNIIPAFAGGHVFSQSMFHSILCQAYYEHNLITLLKMFLFPTDTPDQSTSTFFQIMMPSDGRFVGLPYGSLFSYMLEKHNCVSVGLYRRGSDGKGFQYLMLNPDATTKINEDDSLYLIGPRRPTWEELAPTPA